jgi:hypothetical protein
MRLPPEPGDSSCQFAAKTEMAATMVPIIIGTTKPIGQVVAKYVAIGPIAGDKWQIGRRSSGSHF